MIYFQQTNSNDQYLLEFFVWPWASGRSLQHDSYQCENFARTTAWPSRREDTDGNGKDGAVNNYVGAPFALGGRLDEVCPLQCRPREHKEWAKC